MIKHDAGMMETSVDEREVSLTRIEHKLLTILMDGKLHTRVELLARVWKADPTMKTRTVDVTIGRLKKKLEPDGKFFKTVHGIGYKLKIDGTR